MENLVQDTTVQKPKWIRVKLPTGKNYRELRTLVDKYLNGKTKLTEC